MTTTAFTPPIFGIVGWKNNGKTTLVVRLVEILTARGWRVATVKHAHHDFAIDHQGTDSWRHTQAGAAQVAVVSKHRWAIMSENKHPEDEPDLSEIVSKLDPCDLVLIEGYKQGSHAKLEVYRREGRRGKQGEMLLATSNPHIIAIATDAPLPNTTLPIFNLDDIEAIADFIEHHAQLKGKNPC